MLVIVVPERVHFSDLLRQQFPAEDVKVIVDRRRGDRRRRGRVRVLDDRRSRDRRQHDIRAELQATGWAIIPGPRVMPHPTRPWELPWLRIQVLLRTLRGTRWDGAVSPTAGATLRDALAARSRIRQEGWFN